MIALAILKSSPLASNLQGKVVFKDVPKGVEVRVDVSGLPDFTLKKGESPQVVLHGFHIYLTQTTGNSVKRIACGIIEKLYN